MFLNLAIFHVNILYQILNKKYNGRKMLLLIFFGEKNILPKHNPITLANNAIRSGE